MTDESRSEPDPLPGMIAEIDQAEAAMPMVARLYRIYFDGFKEQGFTDAQALYLAAAQAKMPGPPPN